MIKMYVINTDASIEPFNPGGIVAWGFIVKKAKMVIHKEAGISVKGGEMATNNVGEYHAVVAAMLWLLSRPKDQRMTAVIRSDSELIVNQCSGTWNCRDEKLVPLRDMIMKAKKKYGANVVFKWVPREENQEADELSRSAYDQEELAHWRENSLDIIFDGDDLPF